MKRIRMIALMSIALSGASVVAAADWAPTTASQLTRWGKQVTPENAWREYPRPQLTRDKWENLNGLWDLALDDQAQAPDSEYDHKILVPYPVESSLSGVGQRATYLKYKRNFKIPSDWADQRVLLHFDACDWQTSVSVNGQALKTLDGENAHQGGYDRFSYDITEALKAGEDQEVVVSVFDPTDRGDQPRGKQMDNPHGIWYTPSSGIWQTVWLEPVAQKSFIRGVKFVPDAATGKVKVHVEVPGAKADAKARVVVSGPEANSEVQTVTVNGEGEISGAGKPALWSTDNPVLYNVEVTLLDQDKPVDSVKTYFAFRTIEIKRVGEFQRILLNGKEIFQSGTLDQGFWPDGLHTPPSMEAMNWDVDYTRDLGFNLIRKHIKVEPDTWYHQCDKTGMLIWQDAVSGPFKTAEGKQAYERELTRMIDNHWNSPAIVLWVVFNEEWGQYDTERLTKYVKDKDPSRLVTNASGWVDKNCGDIIDIHQYPGPGSPKPESERAAVLGEFGGLGLFVEGHSWSAKHWGYQGMNTPEDLFNRFEGIMNGLKYLQATRGLCASIYTQITDVEIEANGIVTYDREHQKMETAKVRAINESIINMGDLKVLVPTALDTENDPSKAPQWHYTTDKPADNWMAADFDASAWKTGPAGFGKFGKQVFGVANTEWTSDDIWVRREFEIPAETNLEHIELNIAYLDAVTVYVNGIKAAELPEYVTGYTPIKFSAEALAGLKVGGKNTMAIHCHNMQPSERRKDFGQLIDAGIIETTPAN